MPTNKDITIIHNMLDGLDVVNVNYFFRVAHNSITRRHKSELSRKYIKFSGKRRQKKHPM